MKKSWKLLVSVLAVVLIVAMFSFLGGVQVGRSEFAGIGESMPKYNEITLSYSFILDTNGTHIALGNTTDWRWQNISTNLRPLIANTVKKGVTYYFRNGSYSLSGYILINGYDHVGFYAHAKGAKILYSANSGFNITKNVWDGQIDTVVFDGLFLDGNNAANWAIRATMGNNTRLKQFHLEGTSVWNFVDAGIWITNGEEMRIHDTEFYHNGKVAMRFDTFVYEVGNNDVYANEFDYMTSGANGIQFVAKNRTNNDDAIGAGVGGFRIWGNHFLGTSNTWAFNMTANGLTISAIQSTSDSVEGGGVFLAKTNTTNGIIKGCSYENGRVTNTVSGVPYLFNLGIQAWNTMISNNPYILNTGSGGGILLDNNTSTSTYNIFANNWVASTNGFSPSITTYVHGNTGLTSTYYLLKTRGTDLISTTSKLTNFGATASTVISKTKYTIWTNDVILTISGGTVTNIIVYDSAGTQIADLGSSCTFVRIPRLDILNVTYTGSPTITFQWVS